MALKACKECGHEISTKADACHMCGAKVVKFKLGFWQFVGLIIFGLYLIGSNVGEKGAQTTSTSSNQSAQITSPPPQRRSAASYVNIVSFSWSKSEVNTMELTATLKNTSERPIKDVEITCEHSGPSGIGARCDPQSRLD